MSACIKYQVEVFDLREMTLLPECCHRHERYTVQHHKENSARLSVPVCVCISTKWKIVAPMLGTFQAP